MDDRDHKTDKEALRRYREATLKTYRARGKTKKHYMSFKTKGWFWNPKIECWQCEAISREDIKVRWTKGIKDLFVEELDY